MDAIYDARIHGISPQPPHINKKIFRLKSKKLIDKDIKNVSIDFFSDYIYNLKQQSMEDCSAYQFIFQYRDSVEYYSCSIYPCIIMDKCKSFDVVIRKIVNPREYEFIALL